MIRFEVPGVGTLEVDHLAVDLNGTIAVDGVMIDDVAERLQKLAALVKIYVVTADGTGTVDRLASEHPGLFEVVKIRTGAEAEQKLDVVHSLGRERTIVVGNGTNDCLALQGAVVGIAVIGREGASVDALMNADVVVTDIRDALDLLLNPARLAATLRQ